MDEMSIKLKETGYMTSFIAHSLNLKYKDFIAIKNKKASIKEEDVSTLTTRVKMLLTNTECYTLNQRNMLIKAKGLIYTGGLYAKLSKLPIETIQDYTGWVGATITLTLSKIKADKGKSIYSIKDNEILVLYSLYSHSGTYTEVIYNEEDTTEDIEFTALKNYFIENNVGDFLYNLGYKTKTSMCKTLNISLAKLNLILKAEDITETTRNKNLLQDIYNKVNGNAIHKKKSPMVRANYKVVRFNDLSEEERTWYLGFDFNSLLDNRSGYKEASIIQMLNKLGFNEKYKQTWWNLANHLTDYGNYILVRALYNYVVNNTIIEVEKEQEPEVVEPIKVESTIKKPISNIDTIIESEKKVLESLKVSKVIKEEQEELNKLKELKAIRDEKMKLMKELGLI